MNGKGESEQLERRRKGEERGGTEVQHVQEGIVNKE